VATHYEPDHKGTGQLLVSPGMFDLVNAFADFGMRYAVSISPEDTGDYKDSFRVEEGHVLTMITKGGHRTRRAAARIVNDAPHAPNVEWQWGYHVLGRTIDAIERAKTR
jgi:hypothetical protein